MYQSLKNLTIIGLLVGLFIITGCSGSGGGNDENGSTTKQEFVSSAGVLAPLSNANVEVYDLYNPEDPLYTTTTDSQGSFDVDTISGFSPESLLNVKVTGGTSAGSAVEGSVPAGTELERTLNTLVSVADHNDGDFRVSILTDIVYRYTQNLIETENLIGALPDGVIQERLDYLAEVFIAQDLDGDDIVDGKDILSFNPIHDQHRDSLAFVFELLSQTRESGHSIATSYYQDDTDVLLDVLEEAFGMRLSLYPGLDPASDMVKVTLVATGEGRVTSNIGGFYYDSASEDTQEHIQSVFLERNSEQTIVFTAEPTADTKVLNWSGGNSVPDDMTTYECSLTQDRIISVDFGYKDAELQPDINLVDLSAAEVTISSDHIEIAVSPAPGDTQMENILQNLAIDDYVVGSQEHGFLRKVSNIENPGGNEYLLSTVDASLEEVIYRGSGHLKVRATNADVAETTESSEKMETQSLSTTPGDSLQTTISPEKVETAEGVRFVPSDDPGDTEFTFIIGEQPSSDGPILMSVGDEKGGTFEWEDPETGATLTITGSVEVSIQFEWATDFNWGRLQSFKFVPVIDAIENLDVEINGELKAKEEWEIGSIPFNSITFFIGVVPVRVKGDVSISIGVDAETGNTITAGVELTQTAKGGMLWTNSRGFQRISDFQSGYDLKPTTVDAYAEVTPYLQPEAAMTLYGVTGPKVDVKGYLKLRGEVASDSDSLHGTDIYCDGGINLAASWGVDSGFGWDLGAAGRFTRLIGIDDDSIPRFEIYAHEDVIKSWNVDGACTDLPPNLQVTEGPARISREVDFGTNAIINETISFVNAGHQPMDWRASSSWSSEIIEIAFDNQSIASGRLASGESKSLDISIIFNSPLEYKGMSYINWISLENLNDASESGGSRVIPVCITVSAGTLAEPLLNSAALAENDFGDTLPTQVDLNWDWSDPDNANNLKGFWIFYTTTPDDDYSWSLKERIADPSARQFRAMHLFPSTTYYFAVQAYGENVAPSEPSNILSATTGDVSTVGDFTNSIGMTFNYIEPGTFMMGSPEDEPGRSDDETQHEVTLTQGYYMQTTEVTQGQWEAVMGDNPSNFSDCGDECPVEQVSWYDVQDFIAALNTQEGTMGYALPTEAQWEHAARAGSTTAFANGEITETGFGYDPVLDSMGWYYYNSSRTQSVAQKDPNAWGLYDMHGNVYEWVADWYGTYQSSAVTDPTGPSSGIARVARGGCCGGYARICRSAFRGNYGPGLRFNEIGFRLVLLPGH